MLFLAKNSLQNSPAWGRKTCWPRLLGLRSS